MSVKKGLFALTLFSVLAFGAVVATSIKGMYSSLGSLNAVYVERVVPLKNLKIIADDYAVLVVDTAHKVNHGSLDWSEGIANLDSAKQRLEELWRGYKSQSLNPEEKAIVAQLQPLMDSADTQITRLHKIFESKDADALDQFARNELYAYIDPVSEKFSELAAIQLTLSEEAYLQAKAQNNFVLVVIISVALITLLIFAVALLSFTKMMNSGIRSAIDFCQEIASGHLVHFPGRTKLAEIQALLDALNAMSDRLTHVVQEVNGATIAIHDGSKEIAAGSLHLSERTEQQAANLEQTASSMEQMTAIVKNTAKNSREASGLANQASDMAHTGREVVLGAHEAMANIRQSSEKITSIISVVDEIAFQTNILALNAAVEAARAGDAGRGFAVVASEVRALAQRSAQAANQIKELIQESTDKIKSGGELVEQSAHSLGEIVLAINEVSKLIDGISHASQEQSEGISQVNTAVSQMDRVTQQNAALVEETAAAAQTLENQAELLEATIAYFKFDAPAKPSVALPPVQSSSAKKATPSLGYQRADVGKQRVRSGVTAIPKMTHQAPKPTPSESSSATTRPIQTANQSLADSSSQWTEF
jgi:methyl-accepting chemotaxis protein/methyl-accepting chemotaxis protein-1 (serine sensor receptor)